MGYSKNYIMYWGVFTGIIIAWTYRKVCTKFTKIIGASCAECTVPFPYIWKELQKSAQKMHPFLY